MGLQPGGETPQVSACQVCVNAEKMGGAIRCRACGRWVPRVERSSMKSAGVLGQERRHTRAPDPPCPRCRPDEARPRVTIRLPQRVFFKCDTCRSVWTLELGR